MIRRNLIERSSILLLVIFSFIIAIDAGPAAASSGMMNTSDRPKDRYQCSETRNGEQVVDLLIGGSNDRFQGIARRVNGKVVEVSGVVSSYAMLAPGVPVVPTEVMEKYWARAKIQSEVTIDFMMERFFKDNPQFAPVITDANPQKPPGKPFQGFGAFGGGMMGGYGVFLGTPGGEKITNAAGGPTGFSMGFGFMPGAKPLNEKDYQEIQRRVDKHIEDNEKRRQVLVQEEERRERMKPFEPPPPPPVREAGPRAGDNIPPRVVAPRAGDTAGAAPRAGDAARWEKLPGTKAYYSPRAGANLKALPGHSVGFRQGDNVEERRGAAIGREGVFNFNAALDPKTGKLNYVQHTDSKNQMSVVVENGRTKAGASSISLITEFVSRAQNYSDCCTQDSNAKCDLKFDPKSEAAMARFKEVTADPDLAFTDHTTDNEPGHAIANPFRGDGPKPGVYGPAQPNGTQK